MAEESVEPAVVTGLRADATAAQEQFERQLEASVLSADSTALGGLELLEQGTENNAQAVGWMPDLSELDEAAQTEMLAWLEERI